MSPSMCPRALGCCHLPCSQECPKPPCPSSYFFWNLPPPWAQTQAESCGDLTGQTQHPRSSARQQLPGPGPTRGDAAEQPAGTASPSCGPLPQGRQRGKQPNSTALPISHCDCARGATGKVPTAASGQAPALSDRSLWVPWTQLGSPPGTEPDPRQELSLGDISSWVAA